MNKSDRQLYIDELKKNLKGIPGKEYSDAIQYYTEFLEDGNFTNYIEIVNQLGNPKQLARQISANYSIIKDEDSDNKKTRSITHNMKLIMTILLALSSPILIPIAIALILTVIAIIFAVVVTILAFLVASFILIFDGIVGIATKGIISFALLGVGLMFLGLLAMLPGILYFICRFIIQIITTIIKWIYRSFEKQIKEVNHE